jgi:TM2 domain-containing membrane protein YozV
MSDDTVTGTPQGEPVSPEQQPGQQQPGQQYYAPQPDPQYYAPQQPGYQYAPQGQQYAPQQTGRSGGIGSAHKDKWVATVLAFFLGMFGIHKFYLGYKNEGIIMLVVSLAGGLCLFGLGFLVMTVIAYIEAVRYIILTQEDFERTYVYGSKGWF